MLEERARIIKVLDGKAHLEVLRSSSCNSCSLQQGCGIGLLAKFFEVRKVQFELENVLDLKEGEEVVIGVHENSLLRNAALIYLLPLLSLALSAFVADIVFESLGDGIQIVAGGLGFIVSFWWIHKYQRRIGQEGYMQPAILRRVNLDESVV